MRKQVQIRSTRNKNYPIFLPLKCTAIQPDKGLNPSIRRLTSETWTNCPRRLSTAGFLTTIIERTRPLLQKMEKERISLLLAAAAAAAKNPKPKKVNEKRSIPRGLGHWAPRQKRGLNLVKIESVVVVLVAVVFDRPILVSELRRFQTKGLRSSISLTKGVIFRCSVLDLNCFLASRYALSRDRPWQRGAAAKPRSRLYGRRQRLNRTAPSRSTWETE